jgi:hypothetical protein
MWDALVTAGNLIIVPAVLTTALDRRAYISRLTSGVSFIGLTAVTIGLIGAGLILSPIVVGVIGLIWLFIFLFRHHPPVVPVVEVPEEQPAQ